MINNDPIIATPRENLRVVAAAIFDEQGKLWTLPPPARHLDIELEINQVGGLAQRKGFLLNSNEFASRTKAKEIARRAGQLLACADDYPELTSNEVW